MIALDAFEVGSAGETVVVVTFANSLQTTHEDHEDSMSMSILRSTIGGGARATALAGLLLLWNGAGTCAAAPPTSGGTPRAERGEHSAEAKLGAPSTGDVLTPALKAKLAATATSALRGVPTQEGLSIASQARQLLEGLRDARLSDSDYSAAATRLTHFLRQHRAEFDDHGVWRDPRLAERARAVGKALDSLGSDDPPPPGLRPWWQYLGEALIIIGEFLSRLP